jgi:plastocyanin
VSTLDSRSLTYVNTFGRRFSEPGEVRYRLVTAAVVCQPAIDLPFTIEVAKGKRGKQHDVNVHLEGDGLVAEPPKLSIAAGDLVLWHSVASTPGYAVQGEGEGGRFDSSSLTSETLYTHAFGVPGDFEWTDAIHGSLSGVVKVTSLDSGDPKQCREWMEALAHGTVVVIEGDRADPPEVSVLAGQTVFFAVTAAEGITITDARLVGRSAS